MSFHQYGRLSLCPTGSLCVDASAQFGHSVGGLFCGLLVILGLASSLEIPNSLFPLSVLPKQNTVLIPRPHQPLSGRLTGFLSALHWRGPVGAYLYIRAQTLKWVRRSSFCSDSFISSPGHFRPGYQAPGISSAAFRTDSCISPGVTPRASSRVTPYFFSLVSKILLVNQRPGALTSHPFLFCCVWVCLCGCLFFFFFVVDLGIGVCRCFPVVSPFPACFAPLGRFAIAPPFSHSDPMRPPPPCSRSPPLSKFNSDLGVFGFGFRVGFFYPHVRFISFL